jgi:recombination protein RecR
MARAESPLSLVFHSHNDFTADATAFCSTVNCQPSTVNLPFAMIYPPSLARLIEALRCLPGVGPKSAQRMAFHLLEKDRNAAGALADALQDSIQRVGRCERCRMFADAQLCPICGSPARDRAVLCVVESPADVAAIEQSGSYRGSYFVLMGHLSPLDGIGPKELGFAQLESLFEEGVVKEAILATNTTVEGDATAHVIAELALRHHVQASRIAHGVPVGGELEYVDGGTLAHALAGRHKLS